MQLRARSFQLCDGDTLKVSALLQRDAVCPSPGAQRVSVCTARCRHARVNVSGTPVSSGLRAWREKLGRGVALVAACGL